LNLLTAGLLILSGFGGGLSGSIAGLASLVSYPALLATGLSPVSANVSNTVALVFSSVGSVWGSRPELAGQRQRARRLAPVAAAGGLLGGVLLLVTPSGTFARIVPVLIGLGSLAVLIPRRPTLHPTGAHPTWLAVSIFVISVYGGYFGAAAGVIMLAAIMLATGDLLPTANALKNLLLGGANAVAAVGFALFGPVHWLSVLPLAAGFLIGGRLGPLIVRRLPTGPLRLLIACAGVGLAVHLGLDAYR
jgi:uncharacterized membrane protein YfcA